MQFLSPVSSQSALVHLRGFVLLGRTLEISFSKYAFISVRPGDADRCASLLVVASVPPCCLTLWCLVLTH